MTREKAVRILNAAFGDGEWQRVIEAVGQHERRDAFLRLYSERLRMWGATHILPIPIADEAGTHVYTLVHASKSPKAYATMKEAVAYALKNSPLPADVVERMKRSVGCNFDAVVSAVRQRFAEQEVRWAEDPDDKHAPCVRNFLLEETDAYPFELPKIQARLSSFRLKGRAIVYAFPGGLTDVD